MNKKIVLITIGLLLIPALVLGATLIISNKPINPEDAHIYFVTGNAAYQQKDYESATQHYKKAVSLNPEYEEAHNNLAYLYNKLGDYEKAAEHLEKLIILNPANPGYYYDYAVNLMLQIKKTKKGEIKDIEAALQAFEKTEELSPGYERAQENTIFLENMSAKYYEQQG